MTQIGLFLLCVFSVTFGLCFYLKELASDGGLFVLFIWLYPTVWAPTIVALILSALSGGRMELRREFRRLSFAGLRRGWIPVALILPAVAAGVAGLMARRAGDHAAFISPQGILLALAIQCSTGAIGEEMGWRGFLLPRMVARIGRASSIALAAALWSLWHIAGFLFPGTPHHTLIPAVPFLTAIFSFGIFLGVLFFRSKESVLVTMTAHLSLNVSLAMGGVSLSSTVYWTTIAAVLGAFSVVVWLLAKPVTDSNPPNKAPEPTTMAVTPRASSRTSNETFDS